VNLKHAFSNNHESLSKLVKSDKIRQLSIEQLNAIDNLLQGKSDRAIAEAVGVSRQTVWEWRNKDPLFIAELNRQRVELWSEARERLKALANRALDVVELQLGSDDPKIALAAAKHVLQGTRLLGDTALNLGGPTTTEGVILARLRYEAKQELVADGKHRDPFMVDLFGIEDEVEDLAKSKLKKALMEAGIT
jgi:transcriptional regulator with XRE-family HTH domain